MSELDKIKKRHAAYHITNDAKANAIHLDRALLLAEVERLQQYSNIVAELCPEELFNQIEGELNTRVKEGAL